MEEEKYSIFCLVDNGDTAIIKKESKGSILYAFALICIKSQFEELRATEMRGDVYEVRSIEYGDKEYELYIYIYRTIYFSTRYILIQKGANNG